MFFKVTVFEIRYIFLDPYPENRTLKKNQNKTASLGECNVFSAFQETLDVSFEIVYGSFSAFHPMT